MRAASSASPALEIHRLSKRYGVRVALDDVDLIVRSGTIVGLLGPNGAGKTTLMRVVLGLIHADGGTIHVDGTAHPGMGSTPSGVAGFVDVPQFYPSLSGRRNLALLASLDATYAGFNRANRPANGLGPCDPIASAIDAVGLSAADEPVAHYSAGMRQRLAIAAALVRAPRLLLLDEPTGSLDPAGARDIRALVRLLAARGVAVVFSSHDMGEVEALCSSVTVLDQGRVRFSGCVDEIRSVSRHFVHLRTSDDERAVGLAREQPDLSVASIDESGMEIAGQIEGIDRYVMVLGYAGIAIRSLERRGQTLGSQAAGAWDGTLRDESSWGGTLPDESSWRGASAAQSPGRNSAATRARTHLTIPGILAVTRGEWTKLRAQRWVHGCLALCLVAPWAFVAAMRLQDGVPEDTLFGRGVRESGFAVPLVVLGFAGMWILPAVGAIVAGDLFSTEDRLNTWSSLLTRSRTRSEIFTAKLLIGLVCALCGVVLLGLSSVVAGVVGIGHQPLIDLSGALMPPSRAIVRVTAAWASVTPPVFAFAAFAMLISVWTRRSTAGVALPVVAGLLLQLYAFVNGPELIRRLVITSAFGAWHGLVNEHPYYGPLVAATVVSLAYCVLSVAIGYRIFRTRDIT